VLTLGVGCDSGDGNKDGEQDACANGACATEDVAAAIEAVETPAEDVNRPEEVAAEDAAEAAPDVQAIEEISAPEEIQPVSNDIIIPIADLSTTAKYFTHEWHNVTISYFGVLDEDGGVHMAFDACDVCYGAKKGYSQQGNLMVCNNCGNKFEITGIGTTNKGGGCWPGYLEVTLTETDVVIDPAVLEAGSWYFE
jgi:hypothetical protein